MWKRIVLFAVAIAIVQHLFRVTVKFGYHKIVYNHKPGECEFVKGIESGSEDLELLSDGIVLISAGCLNFKDRVHGAPPGHIYAYDINRHDDGATELRITGDYDVRKLHPHGISSYEDKQTGKIYFFVINHQPGYDVVDIFEFHRSSMSLTFIKSRKDPLMISVNNLVAVSPDEFYITNEANTMNHYLRFIEMYLMLRTGYVLFCDVTSCRRVTEALCEPNGIDLSRDGRYLYVNLLLDGDVLIFERDISDNNLKGYKPLQTIHLWTGLDNIYVDYTGDLWFGGVPNMHTALAYLNNADVKVASQVVRLKFASGKTSGEDYELNEVYSEDGRNLSMSTVALHHNGVLLIGSLYEKMMRCAVQAL